MYFFRNYPEIPRLLLPGDADIFVLPVSKMVKAFAKFAYVFSFLF